MTKTVLLTPDGQQRLHVPDGRGGRLWSTPSLADINDRGQIVGAIWTDFEALSREPLLWDGGANAVRLPTEPGAADEARFINDRGQIVIQREATGEFRGWAGLWDGSTMTDLPTGYALVDLNEAGQLLLDDDDGSIGFWDDGQLTVIPPPPDANGLHAYELSDAGHIVGRSQSTNLPIPGCSTYRHRPFIWHQGTLTRPQASGTAAAVNRSGQVVINEDATGIVCRPPFDALLWADGTSRDLGRLTRASDVNDRGQVVGQVDREAHLWESGRLTDLGSLGGDGTSVQAVNERGQAIGLSQAADGVPHGFVWTSGHMLDLGPMPPEGLTMWGPLDINDRGQIIGYDAGDPADPDDTTAVVWQVHDPALPTDPVEPPCVTATNAAHVQAGRATSFLWFTWAVGSGTSLGSPSETTSLRQTAAGRRDLVDAC